MICDVCGRENAESLRFCQDCGRRLKARDERVVAPTPPNGMPKVELPPSGPMAAPVTASPASAPQASASPEASAPAGGVAPLPAAAIAPTPSTGRASSPGGRRPEAPAFSFAPSSGAPAPMRSEPPRAPSVPPASPGAPAQATAPCPNCHSHNPTLYRFCMTCGAQIATTAGRPADARAAATAHGGMAPAQRSYDARVEGEIIPSPVVEIAPPRSEPAKILTCGRCNGQCAPGTRFCKYCGAPLDPTSIRPEAPPARIARAPEPAPEPAAPARAPEPAARPAPPKPVEPAAANPPRVAAAQAPADPPVAIVPVRQDFARAAGEARAPRGRLVVIVEDGTEGKSFPLVDRPIDIGRTEGDINLEEDPYVSPRHARLIPQGGRWILRDLDSTNRVYLRLKRPHVLRDGDLLLLGLEVLQFQTVNDGETGLGHAIQHGTLLFGSPATPRRARLCQRSIEGITRDVYHVVRDDTVIGRETGDIVFTGDPFLSRRHASIRRDPKSGDFSLSDLDSSNGTYVAIRGEVSLSSGDYVRIGQHLFRVDLGVGPTGARGAQTSSGGA